MLLLWQRKVRVINYTLRDVLATRLTYDASRPCMPTWLLDVHMLAFCVHPEIGVPQALLAGYYAMATVQPETRGYWLRNPHPCPSTRIVSRRESSEAAAKYLNSTARQQGSARSQNPLGSQSACSAPAIHDARSLRRRASSEQPGYL